MQFRAIPKFYYLNGDIQTCMAWTLFAIISSCPLLWRIIDSKNMPFCWSCRKGWVLNAIQALCFQFDTIAVDKCSLFQKNQSMSKFVDKVDANLPEIMNDDPESASYFYEFNLDCFHTIFPRNAYGTKMVVLDSVQQMCMH